jgi:hypothetical protein
MKRLRYQRPTLGIGLIMALAVGTVAGLFGYYGVLQLRKPAGGTAAATSARSAPASPLPEKPAAAPGAHVARLTFLRGRPPLLPDQRNEADVCDILAAVLIFCNARDPDQFLDALIRADRDHQPAADLQLRL